MVAFTATRHDVDVTNAEEVRDFLTPTYPEIATATLTGPDATGSALRYTFDRAIGSKG